MWNTIESNLIWQSDLDSDRDTKFLHWTSLYSYSSQLLFITTLSRVGSKVPFPVPHFITHNNNNWSFAIPYDHHKLISLSLPVALLSVRLPCTKNLGWAVYFLLLLLYSSSHCCTHPIPQEPVFCCQSEYIRFCCFVMPPSVLLTNSCSFGQPKPKQMAYYYDSIFTVIHTPVNSIIC